MSGILLSVVLLGVPPSEGTLVLPPTEAAAVEESIVPMRKGRELREAVRAALRRWARPKTDEAEAAAREFLALYQELQQDDQLGITERESLRQAVRGRLQTLSTQIARSRAAQDRDESDPFPASVDGAADVRPLGQFGGMGGGAGMGMGGGLGMRGFGAESADAGDDLVDLIQKTIAPQSWDVMGGPGSIYYWRTGRAIIVRQRDDIHEHVGDLIWQLQRAGQ